MAPARRRSNTPLIQFMFWIVVVLIVSQLQIRSPSESNDERDDLQQLAPPSSRDYYSAATKPQIQHTSQHARFFLGIFTTADQHTMRAAVRELFALYNDTRVCPFGSTNGRMPPPPPDHCQLIYTFVIGGGKPKANTQIVKPKRASQQLMNEIASKLPLLIKADQRFDATLEQGNDVTFLNILENVHEGKTSTWFYYASNVMAAYDWDYAIKSDVRTGLRLDVFFDFINKNKKQQANFPRRGHRIYSGKLDWATTRGSPFMEGPFYVLSRDLAERVAMERTPKSKDYPQLEDKDMGKTIMKLNLFTHLITFGDWTVGPSETPWVHPLPGPSAFQDFVKAEKVRLAEKLKKNAKSPS